MPRLFADSDEMRKRLRADLILDCQRCCVLASRLLMMLCSNVEFEM